MSLSTPSRMPSTQRWSWQRPAEQNADTQSLAWVQRFWEPQRVQVPPQSTSDSMAFWTLSVHFAGWQVPSWPQTFDVQSPSARHPAPSSHAGHEPPPQSAAVSVPFFVRSVQLAALHFPETHEPLVQSVAALQPCSTPHFGQLSPPQSRPVSPLLLTPSVHDVA
jgi:hypothetical protein